MLERMIKLSELKATDLESFWSKVVYNANGIIVALQSTFDDFENRESTIITPHTHPFDELIYHCLGNYGNHNRTPKEGETYKIPQFGDKLIRIPAGVEHGGTANGLWVSIKPQNHRFSRFTFTGDESVLEYESDRPPQLTISTGISFDYRKPDVYDLVIVPMADGIMLFEPKKESYKPLERVEYIALKLG